MLPSAESEPIPVASPVAEISQSEELMATVSPLSPIVVVPLSVVAPFAVREPVSVVLPVTSRVVASVVHPFTVKDPDPRKV